MTEEKKRLDRDVWKKWGPYLSERQWGIVREDYSENGNPWEYFTYDQARSRAYRWGEDGIGGISDEKQSLCFALALWNSKDSMLKERLFGLTNGEGNHGEDVKEYYFYLDNTPTHSYMKYLYKYPQEAYPYELLREKNKERTHNELEYELCDTGIFDENRYFDIFLEYAKESPEDILINISVFNRGPSESVLHLLPTLWYRNTWSWNGDHYKPQLAEMKNTSNLSIITANHKHNGRYYLYADRVVETLFTENDTNKERIFGIANHSKYVKDGINNYIVHSKIDAINPEKKGTKASFYYKLTIGAGQSTRICLRLSKNEFESNQEIFGKAFDHILENRIMEADEFYQSITSNTISMESANVLRQAMAGILWSKQYYFFDVGEWLQTHKSGPFEINPHPSRNREWFHMINDHIICMPDKWEYPWYAAWDLAFHAIALSLVDLEFAKQQLKLLFQEVYLHPSGQIPAYEWNFGDVNPPVHAWASVFLMRKEKIAQGEMDMDFLHKIFRKLMLNFTWWVNRKDRLGKNVFEGGYLGLDNIGVIDSSKPLPSGGYFEQADGTAWMSLFCQNMFEMSIALTIYDPTYEDLAHKFAQHFLGIASAINREGDEGMWDEEDGFYYDLIRYSNGNRERLKVRSIVGLLPLCATTVIEKKERELIPNIVKKFHEKIIHDPKHIKDIHFTGPDHFGKYERGIGALVNQERLIRILSKMLDEDEFLSPYGIRSLSKYHEKKPYHFSSGGNEYEIKYTPADSNSGLFGGNCNWRGPVWLPINLLIIRALLHYYLYYGNDLKIECPTGSGKMMNLFEVSKEIADRLISIFTTNDKGMKPVFGGNQKFQKDPFWKDNLLFYEYFNGDNGAGIGASHQTGWTATIANLIHFFGTVDPEVMLEKGKSGAFMNFYTEPEKDAKSQEEFEFSPTFEQ